MQKQYIGFDPTFGLQVRHFGTSTSLEKNPISGLGGTFRGPAHGIIKSLKSLNPKLEPETETLSKNYSSGSGEKGGDSRQDFPIAPRIERGPLLYVYTNVKTNKNYGTAWVAVSRKQSQHAFLFALLGDDDAGDDDHNHHHSKVCPRSAGL